MNSKIYEPFNDPDKWRPRMGAPLNAIDLARFQLGLNQIFGLGDDNRPNVRIVWAQDWERTKAFNRYSGDWYPRYLSHTLEEVVTDEAGLPLLKIEYVAAPRYVIEGRVSQADNELALTDTGVEKLVMLDEAGRQQVITSDAFQAAVAEEYEELLRIFDHDHIDPKQSACCQWNARRGYECWGYYRHPDEGDLQYLKAKWREMQARYSTRPDQERTPQEKQQLLTERMRALTEQKRRQKEEIKKELAEFWDSHFAKFDQSPTEQHHGPYHFLSAHNSAGSPAAKG